MNWSAKLRTTPVHAMGPQIGRSNKGATDWSAKKEAKVYSIGPQSRKGVAIWSAKPTRRPAAFVAKATLSRGYGAMNWSANHQ